MKLIGFIGLVLFFIACNRQTVEFKVLVKSNEVEFGIAELKEAIHNNSINESIVINMQIVNEMGEQTFLVTRAENELLIKGGDETGLMYGSLELAELINIDQKIPSLEKALTGKPYIKQRGLKFNVPLDIRTPSYQDAGDAAQNNILEMWNFEFWKAYLDMMAKNRYNVLTLWNPHPFPSMIHLAEYPDITLQNVCGTTFPIDKDRLDEPDAKFIAGCGVSTDVLDNLIVLKEISMNEKIDFWRKVMAYAKDRGVDVYFFTWNIKLNSVAPPGWYREQQNKKGIQGKYGINNDQENQKTIDYLRKAVKEFVLTYPDLAGIGITAGENMEDRNDEFDREKWLWATYGEGICDAKKQQPDRKIKFIHRYWQSDISGIVDDFISKYPDEINLSFKYARARMYATPNPHWADEYINEYSKLGLKSWWNIRNDDIFNFRWGDPEFASAFIKNIPSENLTAGYFMGSDGYVWGREFTSKHPKNPRELEIDKHWYNFMLWGRLGYNPDMSSDQIKGQLKLKYPIEDISKLYDAWATASRIPSAVTSFHWNDWDFQWAVEGCLDLRNGFHDVNRFINNPTMNGSGILTIPETVESQKSKSNREGITPLQIADSIDSMANMVLRFTENQEEGLLSPSYDELVYDLKAWAFMGKYYANKIKGAYFLHAYNEGLGSENKNLSIVALTSASLMWKEYAKAASRNYLPQFMAKTRTIDWEKLSTDVDQDIEIVKSRIK